MKQPSPLKIAVALYESGDTQREASLKAGISVGQLQYHIKTRFPHLIRDSGRPRQDDVTTALQLFEGGMTASRASQIAGVSENSIFKRRQSEETL